MASLLDLQRNVQSLTRPMRPSRFERRDPTQYEMEMSYFVQPRKEEEEKKRRRRPLLQVIFDVLQTGNYMSANIADSVTDSIKYGKPLGEGVRDALDAAWKGLTWQEKNTFSDVIRQNAEEHGEFLGRDLDEWTKEVGDVTEGKTKFGQLVNNLIGKSTPAARVGFLGDILLDPLTYISPLKSIRPTGLATKGARAAAEKYAPDVVKLTNMMRNIEDLKGVAKTGASSLDDILRKGTRGMAHANERLFRESYQKALTTPADVLQKEMREQLGELVSTHMKRTLDGVQKPEVLDGVARDIESLVRSIGEGYGGAGMRGRFDLPFVGTVGARELSGGQRPNIIARGVDRLGDLIQKRMSDSKLGQHLTDAWWARTNDPYSIIGAIRRTFGIRNPYQKYLNMIRLDSVGTREEIVDRLADFGNKALQDLGEENLQKATGLRAVLEQVEMGMNRAQKQGKASREALEVFAGKPGSGMTRRQMASAAIGDESVGRFTVQDLLPKLKEGDLDAAIKQLKEGKFDTKVLEDIKRLNITPDEAERISDFWTQMDDMFKNMRDEEMQLINDGVFSRDVMGEWINYIPKVQGRPMIGRKRPGKLLSPADPGFMKETKLTYRQSQRQGIELAKEFFGDWIKAEADSTGRAVDDIAREFVERGGLAPISQNLTEMVNARIMAHARVMARGRLIKQLREFGIRMDQLDLGKFPRAAINRMGDVYNGLQQSTDPGLKGYLFDKDVADIIDKTYSIAASDDTLQGLKRYFGNFTSWWKGMATATPGFHLRNFFSNNVTGVFRHGGKWLDPRREIQSMVGTYYALHPNKYIDLLTKDFNISPEKISNALGSEIAGKTLKEWADMAREDGIISLRTMIGDVTKEVQPKVRIGTRFNPASQQFGLTAGSRAVGTAIENHARFKSYLLSIEELSKAGVADDAMANFAKMDTKKWFIDYSDLTEVEQKVLKKVIPFYTWLRKNVSNQLSGLMLMPEMYRVAAKAEEAIAADDFDFSTVQDYIKELGYLPVGMGETGPVMWWPNFPYGDLNKIPLFFEDTDILSGGLIPRRDKGALLEEFGSSAHPVIKNVIQRLTDKNLFRQRDFLDRVDAPIGQIFSGSPQVVAFLDKAMKMAGYENGAGINIRDGKLQIDEELEQAMSNNIPLLRTLTRVFDLGVDITGVEEAIEKSTGRKSPYEGMEELFQHLSTFLGLKFKEVDQEYQRELMARAIEEAAQKDRSAWKRTLPGYAQRSSVWQRGQAAQRRRIGL